VVVAVVVRQFITGERIDIFRLVVLARGLVVLLADVVLLAVVFVDAVFGDEGEAVSEAVGEIDVFDALAVIEGEVAS
jgi:hypothetical protein